MSSTIIDWTYNGGYLSLREGINSMKSFIRSHRIIFFLGDMRELWTVSKQIHEKLAQDILDILPHDAQITFYLVGPLMHEYVFPILSTKFNTITHLSSQKLGKLIAEDLKNNTSETIVYAKWSQNTIFIEEWVKFLLKNPTDIQKLPRQSESWLSKKWAFFRSIEK